MNIFVTSESNNKDVVADAVNKIRDKGHDVIYTWHNRPKLNNIVSLESLSAIRNSHIHLVIFPLGRGSHIEIGFSLENGKKTVGIYNNNLSNKIGPYGHFAEWHPDIDSFLRTLPEVSSIEN